MIERMPGSPLGQPRDREAGERQQPARQPACAGRCRSMYVCMCDSRGGLVAAVGPIALLGRRRRSNRPAHTNMCESAVGGVRDGSSEPPSSPCRREGRQRRQWTFWHRPSNPCSLAPIHLSARLAPRVARLSDVPSNSRVPADPNRWDDARRTARRTGFETELRGWLGGLMADSGAGVQAVGGRPSYGTRRGMLAEQCVKPSTCALLRSSIALWRVGVSIAVAPSSHARDKTIARANDRAGVVGGLTHHGV